MSKVSVRAAAITVVVMMMASLTACGGSGIVDQVEDIIRSTEPPEKVIEQVMPTAAPIGETVDLTPTTDESYTSRMVKERLLDYLGGSGSVTAEYTSSVIVCDDEYADGAMYDVFEVSNNGSFLDKYYVNVERGGGLYKSSDFYKRYFAGAADVYSVTNAKADLLAELDSMAGVSADYRSTVTEDSEDYSGEVTYYVFSVKQGGTYLEDYYVLVTNFGGMILTGMDHNTN